MRRILAIKVVFLQLKRLFVSKTKHFTFPTGNPYIYVYNEVMVNNLYGGIMKTAHQIEETYKQMATELGLSYQELLDALSAPIVADDFQKTIERNVA